MQGKIRGLMAIALSAGLLSGCVGLPFPQGYMDSRSTAPNGGALAGGTGEAGDPSGQQGTSLKGGERDDNADFAGYLEYLSKYRQGSKGDGPWLDVTERYPLRIIDEASKSVPNATITVSHGSELVLSARTTADGRLYFHPKAFPAIATSQDDLTIEVSKGGSTLNRTLSRNGEALEPFVMPGQRGAIAPKLDLCFVLDVTGSMGDELDKIQATIGEIAFRIQSLPGSPAVRYGLVAYRDHGDAFVTLKHDFTGDLGTFKQRLNALSAMGGGDYPEALNPALNEAVTQLSWDDGEAVRLTFVVGDAPPNLSNPQDVPYTVSMVKALERGIKIVPLAASGLDAFGEFVFRQLAQFTGGKFLFLTYGGQTSHQVGPVQENNLDDLVVGIVKAELSHLE
ncbi:hypothetical protein D3C72_179790 [compost metagenome]